MLEESQKNLMCSRLIMRNVFQNPTTMSTEYELLYWPLAGRGEFIRLIFEDAGVPFKDNSDVQAITAIKEGKEAFYPSFAPPFLKRGKSEREIGELQSQKVGPSLKKS